MNVFTNNWPNTRITSLVPNRAVTIVCTFDLRLIIDCDRVTSVWIQFHFTILSHTSTQWAPLNRWPSLGSLFKLWRRHHNTSTMFLLDNFQTLFDRKVNEGQPVTLECVLQPSPIPDKIQWFCNNAEVFPSTDYQISCRQGVCRLQIAEVFPEDSGVYTCCATYGGSPNSTSMRLAVEGLSEINIC